MGEGREPPVLSSHLIMAPRSRRIGDRALEPDDWFKLHNIWLRGTEDPPGHICSAFQWSRPTHPKMPLAVMVHTLMNLTTFDVWGCKWQLDWFWSLSMLEPLIITAILLLMCNSLGIMDPGYCGPVYLF